MNVFAGAAVVQNVRRDAAGFRTNLDQRWNPVAGEWTVTAGGLRGRRMDNGFRLSDRARPDVLPEGGGRRFTHQVFLDGDTTPVIDVCDGTYAGGRFGVNVFDAVGEAQDLTLS
ncbi:MULTISPECIES: hypothetical protein [Micromonospora]|uniref:Uncharacterized protein n=1 Tax=Micromonospora sicca TaxID=2202420 RepID=A0A317D129_9ACTN|nr:MULTISPECIES: hypothetical protein [unclassified Micromonospora]MBM0227408.1 hypothetical protein [Micromonospora sp. ATA51]PWR08419.1 hypothetical protein DKT69_32880 [Micromonospora sp. 4G51]